MNEPQHTPGPWHVEERWPAYSVAELSELLRMHVDWLGDNDKSGGNVSVHYWSAAHAWVVALASAPTSESASAPTQADALAQLLIDLITNEALAPKETT